MEMNELKQAWHAMNQRLEQQERMGGGLIRDLRLDKARGHLRPLMWMQVLQAAFGIGLIALGAACWTSNTHVPGLLVSGLLVHAFGLAHVIFAVITVVLIRQIDYAAPVLVIQRRLARLLRVHGLNTVICGWVWWIMWIPVVVAFAGIGGYPADADTPAWIWASLAIGVVGLVGTWLFQAWRLRRDTGRADNEGPAHCDGSDGIRRSQRLLAELADFEQE